MRKLTSMEEWALELMVKHGGSYCPGADGNHSLLVAVLSDLVKKKRVRVEMTDDGARYHAL